MTELSISRQTQLFILKSHVFQNNLNCDHTPYSVISFKMPEDILTNMLDSLQ